MNKVERIKELVKILNEASYAYYQKDNPIMTDKQYDQLFDELEQLEKETEIIMANSPTQKVQGFLLDSLKKVEHTVPMLSANKTKDINEIKKFIGNRSVVCSFKLDGCFSGDTRIMMADGSNKKIKDIQIGDMVMSFDENTKKISKEKVINVYHNEKKEFNEWVRLKLFRTDFHKNPYILRCTKNHKIFTNNGWVYAGNIKNGDKIYHYDYLLSQEQKDFLLGIGLGDGWLLYRKREKSTNLEQKLECHYSKVKNNGYDIMIDYANKLFLYNNPKITERVSGYGSHMVDINLHSIKVPDYLYKQENHLRCGLTFTKELCEKLTPLALAILYIDDGNKSPNIEDGYENTFNKKVRCNIATNRHSLSEVQRFSKTLNKLGYENTYSFEKEVVSKKGEGYRITLTVNGTEKFFDDIAKYIPKELRKIKLGLKDKWQNCEEYKWWEKTGEYGLCDDGIVVEIENGFRKKQENKNNRKSYLDSYDLEIENNHTYFANNYAVHNCTLVTRFSNGKFVQAITRGSGYIGEDVTEQAKMIINLPMEIPYKGDLELRGECVISWNNFKKINENLSEPFSHPRNAASGSIRQLDTNITKQRNLEYVVFDLVKGKEFTYKNQSLNWLDTLGFTTVDRICLPSPGCEDSPCFDNSLVTDTLEKVEDYLSAENSKYPVDGQIYEYDNIQYAQSLGSTSHHNNKMIARKWADDTYETILKDIEWSMGRSGTLTPVAVFEPVEMDGAIVERASLHNISIMKELELSYGDTITTYKANMIIPQIDDNLDRTFTNIIIPPTKCPVCSGKTEIVKENNSEVLVCTNPNCKGKLLGKLELFCSKEAMDIKGLSTSQLQTFIDQGWLKDISDIYSLHNYKKEMSKLNGFGAKSVTKLLEAIENSRLVTLDKFVRSLGINLIGKSASKDLTKFVNGDITLFEEDIDSRVDFSTKIDGFGEKMNKSLYDWFYDELNRIIYNKLKKELTFIGKNPGVVTQQLFDKFMNAPVDDETKQDNTLDNKTFCITGKLNHYANRDALVAEIEKYGGKYVSSVSAKLDYLINNDTTSTSGKNKKMHELGKADHIISEEDFIKMIGV